MRIRRFEAKKLVLLPKLRQNGQTAFVKNESGLRIHICFKRKCFSYTDEMQAAIREKSVAMLHLMFENGDFGFFHSSLSYTHTLLAEYYAGTGETEKALDRLQKAAFHAIRFLEQCENPEEHTSVLFIGWKDGSFSTGDTDNTAAEVLSAMEKSVFDGIRSTDVFTSVKDELASYAGKWSV